MLYVASFVLAWLSWRWIETPFRHGMRSIGFGEALRIVVGAAVVLIVTSVAIQRGTGLPGRYPPRALAYLQPSAIDVKDGAFQTFEAERRPDLLVRQFDGTSAAGVSVDCLVWGDSHAVAALGLLDELFVAHGIRGAWACRNAHYPLLGTVRSSRAHGRKPWLQWSDDIVERVRAERIPHVILVSDWEAVNSATLDEGTFGASDDGGGESTLKRSLLKTCRALNDAGATVWLIEPQPYQPADPLRWLVWTSALGRPVMRGVDRRHYDRVQGSTFDAFAAAAKGAEVRITPARDVWFDAEGKSFVGDESRCFYADVTHVSPEGMRRVYRGPFEAMVKSIAASPRGDAATWPEAPVGDSPAAAKTIER
jgi:hypothetical protein